MEFATRLKQIKTLFFADYGLHNDSSIFFHLRFFFNKNSQYLTSFKTGNIMQGKASNFLYIKLHSGLQKQVS